MELEEEEVKVELEEERKKEGMKDHSLFSGICALRRLKIINRASFHVQIDHSRLCYEKR